MYLHKYLYVYIYTRKHSFKAKALTSGLDSKGTYRKQKPQS